MKLTVIGATGRTGRCVLAAGARRGHEMTAFTRRPALLTDHSGLARVVEGDGLDPDAVSAAVAGADAVIAIVKAASRNGPHQTAAVAEVLVAAMPAAGVRRLVMTSAYPVVATRPLIQMTVLRVAFRAGYADMIKMEQVLAPSDLDWTVARLYGLVEKPTRGGVSMRRGLFEKPSTLSREDAAGALLDLAEDDAYARVAVNIAGA